MGRAELLLLLLYAAGGLACVWSLLVPTPLLDPPLATSAHVVEAEGGVGGVAG